MKTIASYSAVSCLSPASRSRFVFESMKWIRRNWWLRTQTASQFGSIPRPAIFPKKPPVSDQSIQKRIMERTALPINFHGRILGQSESCRTGSSEHIIRFFLMAQPITHNDSRWQRLAVIDASFGSAEWASTAILIKGRTCLPCQA